MLELSRKAGVLPFLWPPTKCTSRMLSATDPYTVTRAGLRSVLGNRRHIGGRFSAATSGLQCRARGEEGRLAAEFFAEELRRHGAKPSVELANDRPCISAWFDISSRARLAYYKVWVTIAQESKVWRAYTLVYLRNPDAIVVTNLNTIDEALSLLAKKCGFCPSQG